MRNRTVELTFDLFIEIIYRQIGFYGEAKMALPIKKKALIKTERLIIKPFSAADVDGLVNLLLNPEITKTFMVPKFESVEQMKDLAEKLIEFSREEDTTHLEYGICLNGKIIGFINDCGIKDEEIEIGYVIHPDNQGHGYATEAVRAIICELREMGFRKVIAGYSQLSCNGKMRNEADLCYRRRRIPRQDSFMPLL